MECPDHSWATPRGGATSAAGLSHGTALFALMLLCSCQPTLAGPGELRCVFSGEFPPTDCAFVRGIALRESGEPWAGLAVRVDSAIPMVGYAYASNATSTDRDGRFSLEVVRVNRLVARTDPDTVVIEFKGYWGALITRALVRVRFVPRDSLVIPTDAELRFSTLPVP